MHKQQIKYGGLCINIHKLYATSATSSGIGMLMHSGFKETGVLIGKRIAFVLDITDTDIPLFREYKKAYKEWESSKNHIV